jgi:hypothetical protein
MSVFGLGLLMMLADPIPKEATYILTTRVDITAPGGGVITAGVPLAREWPEQDVEIIRQETVRCKFRVQNVSPGAMMAMVTTRKLPPDGTASVTIVQRITARIQPPVPMDQLVAVPMKNASLKPYLVPTPGVESQDKRIVAKANELAKGLDNPLEKARKFAEWTRGHIKYKLQDFTSAKEALEYGIGDCEELAVLFIALCRSHGIPARKVCSPGFNTKQTNHSWAEICLAKPDGTEVWLPVDVGLGLFGHMPAPVLALYKGEGYHSGPMTVAKHSLQYWYSAKTALPEVVFDQEAQPETPGAELELTRYVNKGAFDKPRDPEKPATPSP